MPPAGFEPTIPASARPQNYAFDRAATGIGERKTICRCHIEMIEAKAFRPFIRVCSLFKSERLNANIKLTLHKALIRSVVTYSCPAWKFAVDAHPDLMPRLKKE
jgi:hypothetical protein